MENTETQVWLDFAFSCEYIPKEIFDDFNKQSKEIGRLLNHIPDKSGLKSISSPVFRLPARTYPARMTRSAGRTVRAGRLKTEDCGL